MKRFMAILLAALLGTTALSAMDAPAAAAAAAKGAEAQAQTQNLIIKNNYPGAIVVIFTRRDIPDPIRFTIQPNESDVIRDLKSVIDIRFEAHGQYKQYLNIKTSPNYRASINELLVNNKTDDVEITVDFTKIFSEQTAQQQAVTFPAEWKGWSTLWEAGAATYQKAKELGTQAVQTMGAVAGPFNVTWKIKHKEAGLKEKEPKSEPYEGKALYEAFPAAKKRILANQPVLGRHILNLTDPFSIVSAIARKDDLILSWNAQRDAYVQKQDPRTVAFIDEVLQFINEAFNDPNKEFSKDRLSKQG